MGAGPGMMFRKNSGAPVVFCSWILARIIKSHFLLWDSICSFKTEWFGFGLHVEDMVL